MSVKPVLVNLKNMTIAGSSQQMHHKEDSRVEEHHSTTHPLLQSAILHSVLRKERRELWQNSKRFELLDQVRKFLNFEEEDDDEDEDQIPSVECRRSARLKMRNINLTNRACEDGENVKILEKVKILENIGEDVKILENENEKERRDARKSDLLDDDKRVLIPEENDDDDDDETSKQKPEVVPKASRKTKKQIDQEKQQNEMYIKKFTALCMKDCRFVELFQEDYRNLTAKKMELIKSLFEQTGIAPQKAIEFQPKRIQLIFGNNAKTLTTNQIRVCCDKVLCELIKSIIGTRQIAKRNIDTICSSYDKNPATTIQILQTSKDMTWDYIRQTLLSSRGTTK